MTFTAHPYVMYMNGQLTHAISASISDRVSLELFLNKDYGLPKRIKLIASLSTDENSQILLDQFNMVSVYYLWRVAVTDFNEPIRRISHLSMTIIDNDVLNIEWGDTLDHKEYRLLVDQLVSECSQRDISEFSEHALEPSFVFLGKKVVLIRDKKNQSIGYVSFDIQDTRLYVWTMYIVPEYRSSYCFYLLFVMLMQYAKDAGCLYIEASTDTTVVNPLNDLFRKRGGIHVSTTYKSTHEG